MIIIDKITTKMGDKGFTFGPNSKKIKKNSSQIEFLGILDELNVFIGNAILFCENHEINTIMQKIQHQIFDIGAAFYNENENNVKNHILFLEQNINSLNINLKPLDSFLLPLGNESIISLHKARCWARKAERAFFACENNLSNIGIYLNRMSDLFFIFVRKTTNNEKKWNQNSSKLEDKAAV